VDPRSVADDDAEQVLRRRLKPSVDKIVFRIIPDANAQVTALQNGEVDIINPQASADKLRKAIQAAIDGKGILP